MKKLMEQMAEELSAAFEKSGYDPSYGKVTVSNRPDLCEFQCNGAMAGAKAYKKAPFMIADDVVAYLKDSQVFSMAEVVKPGFINLKVKGEFLADYLKEMAADEKLSVSAAKEPKTIIIDYGGPNVAKPLHVGHLRSAIIGESIKRIGKFAGHKVTAVRDYKLDEITDLATGEKKPTGLPNSNVLYYELTDDAWVCVRPSGTEPKVKFYYGVKGTSLADADEKSDAMGKAVLEMVDSMK